VVRTTDIRNIVLLGHGGSGKTSLAEAILHKTGATTRLGSVDDQTTTCDYYDEEKEHRHSIQSAVVHASYAGKLINVIDTPGYLSCVRQRAMGINLRYPQFGPIPRHVRMVPRQPG